MRGVDYFYQETEAGISQGVAVLWTGHGNEIDDELCLWISFVVYTLRQPPWQPPFYINCEELTRGDHLAE